MLVGPETAEAFRIFVWKVSGEKESDTAAFVACYVSFYKNYV